MDANTQRGKIIEYCEKYGSITVRDAFEKLYINSPTKRISELREAGYDVTTKEEHRENAVGNSVRYYRYYISRPNIPDLYVGQKVEFDPFESDSGSGVEYCRGNVTGTIDFVNKRHKWFSVVYGDNLRESFKFSDLGETVKLIG